MAMGRSGAVQDDLMATWAEMPRSPGHAFYDRLHQVFREAGFDGFVEGVCKPYYAPRMGAPSLPPGRYFRMHMIGYFEGLDSERGIAWRCADSYSLRDFLRLSNRDKVPDHSWLSRTRSRLPHEAHEKVFGWVLKLVAERGLVKGERIGVDGSTMEANAALRTIVRRDNGESYRVMLTRMGQESGIETPSAEDLARFDCKRKGKTLSNADWKSPTDPDARIAKMKDGTTHLAYKPEHAVDLDTGVVVAAPIHPADEGDTATLSPTLEVAARNLGEIGLAPSEEEPCDLAADKGYHARKQLRALEGGVWKTRIAEPEPAKGYLRWHGDEAARRAVYANRARLKSGVGRETMRRRGELIERSFAHILDRGGMRRAWLRGRENINKLYLVNVAGSNLGVLMRVLHGQGTPARPETPAPPSFTTLFQGLCAPPAPPSACSTHPSSQQYNIQTTAWLDKTSHTGTTNPHAIPLGLGYDMKHSHQAFLAMCDARGRLTSRAATGKWRPTANPSIAATPIANFLAEKYASGSPARLNFGYTISNRNSAKSNFFCAKRGTTFLRPAPIALNNINALRLVHMPQLSKTSVRCSHIWISPRPMVGQTICSRPTRVPASRRTNTCLERHRLHRRRTITTAFSLRKTLANLPDVSRRARAKCC
jgi:transposase